jgi:hypothetical protein
VQTRSTTYFMSNIKARIWDAAEYELKSQKELLEKKDAIRHN